MRLYASDLYDPVSGEFDLLVIDEHTLDEIETVEGEKIMGYMEMVAINRNTVELLMNRQQIGADDMADKLKYASRKSFIETLRKGYMPKRKAKILAEELGVSLADLCICPSPTQETFSDEFDRLTTEQLLREILVTLKYIERLMGE